MTKQIDMLNGDIKITLIKISLPIILTNLIQTALGMFDMIWVGRLGSNAVSAIGTASFYVNLATAVSTIITVGAAVLVAQALGSEDKKEARLITKNALFLSVLISVLFSVVVSMNSKQLLSFFGIKEFIILRMANDYLQVSLIGVPFLFLVSTYTSVFTSYGNTKETFRANSIGLVINLVLDPIFIFGFSIFPALGVSGAAWTNNIARIITLVLLVLNSNSEIKSSFRERMKIDKVLRIFKLSFPVTAQRILFIFISMIMTRIIVRFGSEAIAVQKIGVQIESISYVTVGGLQGAVAAFVGQNYGAKNIDRIDKGYGISLRLVFFFGILISSVFIVFPKQIFGIFISEPNVINSGVEYMRVIGYSQLFMCIELLTVGAFNGIGKTYAPPIISIIFTLGRIPLALLLSEYLGLSGVWWSISIFSILKGIGLYIWFKMTMRKEKLQNE